MLTSSVFFSLGQSVRKLMAMADHGLFGMGSGRSLPAGRWWGTLARAHLAQDETMLFTSLFIEFHQYLSLMSFRVGSVPDCPMPR